MKKCLVIVALFFVAGAMSAQPKQRVVKPSDSLNGQEAKQTEQDQKNAARAIQDLVGLMRAEQQRAAENAQAEQNRNAYENEIQRKLANYTLLLAAVGFLQFLVLVGTGYVVYLQRNLMSEHATHFHNLANATEDAAKAARDQIALADKQFTSSHRPWVTVWGEITNQLLVFRDGKASIAISFTIKNGGSAPALNTITVVEGLKFGPMPRTLAEARKIIDCGKDSPASAINNETGALLLPDEVRTADYGLITENAITDQNPQEVWFTLCIRYKDERGELHGTGFLWKFIHTDGSHQIKPFGTVRGRFIQIGIGNQAY